MGGILGSTGANQGAGGGQAASGILGSLSKGAGALSSLSPWGAAFNAVGGVIGNWKKNKAAKKEQEAAQALADENRNALMGYQQSPEAQALLAQMRGPQTASSTSSTSGSSSQWSDQVSGAEFAPQDQAEMERILADAKAGVGRAQTLSDEEIRAGAQSMAADAAMRRGALQNRAARIGGVSASDLALGDPALAAANRAQSQLIADAKNKAYERGEQARGIYSNLFSDWKKKMRQKMKGGGTQSSTTSGSSTQSADPSALATAFQMGAPIARTYVPRNQPQ